MVTAAIRGIPERADLDALHAQQDLRLRLEADRAEIDLDGFRHGKPSLFQCGPGGRYDWAPA